MGKWKHILIYAALIIAVIRFRNQIASALAKVPVVNKLAGAA